jgi:hypothetical protein
MTERYTRCNMLRMTVDFFIAASNGRTMTASLGPEKVVGGLTRMEI